jgi:ribonuclease HI
VNLPLIEIYTDGACSGNPGPGGWAAIIIDGDEEREISGGEPRTTNQRMELKAAIEALQALPAPSRVKLYSDSAYLVNCFLQNWMARWQKNGWTNTKGKPVENQDLWRKLAELNAKHRVSWIKVKGHHDNLYNERCDALARRAAAACAYLD